MLIIVGYIIVIASVIVGYVAHHGNILVLYQPTEYLIIGGAAVGLLVASSGPAQIKSIIKQFTHALTYKGVTQEQYMELLLCLFEITKTAKGNLLALEAHVENPENSEIFKRYPGVLANHHAIHFLCDTMKIQISAPMSPYDLDDLMSEDMKTMHHEEERVPDLIAKMGDAMPALGIVAAVLGVVITMGKLTQGKEVIGHSVAGALVGTFLGVLLSYGIVQPLSTKLAGIIKEEGKYLEVIKACLIAFAKEASPKVCIEYARRVIPLDVRPSFSDLDQATANIKKAA